MNCPTCGRATSASARWCVGCQTDFATGLPRRAAQEARGPGDAAGEHLTMARGEHGAWPAVVMAFVLNLVLSWRGLELVFTVLAEEVSTRVSVAAFVAGLVLSTALFFNRWRCIEAFTSQSYEGTRGGTVGRFFLLHGALNALLYAWRRGVMKFVGR